MDNFNKELFADEERLAEYLQGLFREAYAAGISLPAVRAAILAGRKDFIFSKNSEKALNKILQTMASQMNIVILSGIERGFKHGEERFFSMLQTALPQGKHWLEEVRRTRTIATDYHRAAASYASGKRGEFTLSERVWKIAGNAKSEIETIVQNGIIEGKSADEISRSIKRYLHEPERIYKRGRSKNTGELELSEAAKNYRPGMGIYRSSYKNTMRLVRTEINAAYRFSQWQQIQKNPLVIGYKIALSNNHTTLIKGKATPFTDICDELAGEYPKDFVWTGWHPQCRCTMTPLPISENDFQKRMSAYNNGTIESWQPSGIISTPPQGFKNWLARNSTRIATSKNGAMPQWLKDNAKML